MSVSEAYQPIDLRDVNQYPKFYFAGFGRRLSAFIIDFAIYLLMTIAGMHFIVVTFMVPKMQGGAVNITDFADHVMFWQLAVTALFALYVIVMHKRRGATIGKIICKIKVVRTDGKSLTYGDTMIRYLPHLILLVLALVVPPNFSQKPTKVVTSKQVTFSSSGG
ncbi:MAG: RDD family protein, partial [Alphaproteobacteria bacterium]|nr:RDD family protein [Alphaproteobacteria bacterium]